MPIGDTKAPIVQPGAHLPRRIPSVTAASRQARNPQQTVWLAQMASV